MFLKPSKDTDQDSGKLFLYRSLIIMIGSFLERSPKANEINRSTLRDLIKHTEIALGLREGKLSVSQYGHLLTMLDTIAPFRDGELTGDLEVLDALLQDYGDKLSEKNRV